jgi:hypothetical protein
MAVKVLLMRQRCPVTAQLVSSTLLRSDDELVLWVSLCRATGGALYATGQIDVVGSTAMHAEVPPTFRYARVHKEKAPMRKIVARA